MKKYFNLWCCIQNSMPCKAFTYYFWKSTWIYKKIWWNQISSVILFWWKIWKKKYEKISKECIICHYWYFLNKGFRFQLTVCKGCYDILIMSTNINSIAILNILGVDYCSIIVGITKNDSKNLIRNAALNEKSGSL